MESVLQIQQVLSDTAFLVAHLITTGNAIGFAGDILLCIVTLFQGHQLLSESALKGSFGDKN